MNSGMFNKAIVFQQRADSSNENGFLSDEWTDIKTLLGAVKTVRGQEYYRAATVQAENDVRFIIRYTTGLTTDMRIKYQDRAFEIQSIINDDELNKTLTIIGREVA